MSKHETPLTERFWSEQARGTLCLEHRVVSTTKTNSYRCIDGVIWPADPRQKVGQLDVAGKDVISVQTKAAPLDSHVIGQAFFSKRLLLDHGKVRSVRTVALVRG